MKKAIVRKPVKRSVYGFETMRKGEVKKIFVPNDNLIVGIRVRCAAYAYGRRNGKSFATETTTERGKKYLLIEMVG